MRTAAACGPISLGGQSASLSYLLPAQQMLDPDSTRLQETLGDEPLYSRTWIQLSKSHTGPLSPTHYKQRSQLTFHT